MAQPIRVVDRPLWLAAALLLPTFAWSTETPEIAWEFPDPVEYSSYLTELCKPEVSSALYIAALRDKGLTKAQVAGALPRGRPMRLRLTHVVEENLNDLFAFPEVSWITYSAFRGRACSAEKAEGQPPLPFKSIATEAMRCQKDIGEQDRPRLGACIYDVMTKAMANTSPERTRD